MNNHPCDIKKCSARLCTSCYGRHPLLLPKTSDDENKEKKNTTHQYGIPYSDCDMKHLCKSCFRENSNLDFSSSYHRIEHDDDAHKSNVTFVFVHGGSSNQQMFHHHALQFKEKFGHSSVLLDLPGHGTLVETPLTIDACDVQLGRVLTECGLIVKNGDGKYTKTNSDQKLVYVGGSLGAYVGFHVLDTYQSIFDGAVMMDCGQNVGPDCSFKAKAGLVVLRWMGSGMTNAKLAELMMGETKKSKHSDYYIVETTFGAGWFFDQVAAQVNCLHTVAPAEYIPRLKFPILFMNGSKDYRDSESKWLELCKHSDSELKVYEGGDHFFIHDSRFVEDILTRINDLVKKL